MVEGSAGVEGSGGSIGASSGGGRRRDSQVSRSIFSLYEYIFSKLVACRQSKISSRTELFAAQDPVSWLNSKDSWDSV